ncbi:MAG TPA: NAD-dependent epimerase/dehydratase family protein, partial [Roseiflexaceae bacterium]|nr:NAD-dependent epimerase/dehydratase family protein [Roseiflexaceae bacterium]
MRILVSGGECPIAGVVVTALQSEHDVRVVARPGTTPSGSAGYQAGDIRDAAFAASIVGDVDAIVHLAPLAARDDADEWIDTATRGTYALLNEALQAGVRRIVVGSTLDLFERVDPAWRVQPRWRPRPQAEPAQLAAWLAELSARELGRFPHAAVACVRFGDASSAEIGATLASALDAPPGFTAFHTGARPYRKLPDIALPIARPIRTVAIFGAGGPLGAELARELAPHYRLRLSDVQPLAELAQRPRPDQHADAPRPVPLAAPHDEMVADITDPAQVLAVCEGVDAIVNCSVVRHHPVEAFRVNTLGAYAIMR